MIRRPIPALTILLASLLILPHALAAGKSFDFKDPKGVNTLVVTLDSVLEPVSGIASGVSGTIHFDPADPKSATGKLVVDVTSLQFVHRLYTETAHGPRGLDAQSYPRIEFTLKQVRDVRKIGANVYTGTVIGDFSLHGVTRTIAIPLRATYLEGKARDRNRRGGGDLLVLRTTFKIRRSDYGIARGTAPELLAEEVEIRANLVGLAPEGTP